jgi:hypothetical protein
VPVKKRTSSRSTSRTGSSSRAGARKSQYVVCQAPGCQRRFIPYRPLRGRQRFCSPACRQRDFYWTFKRKHRGKRYAAVMGYGRSAD